MGEVVIHYLLLIYNIGVIIIDNETKMQLTIDFAREALAYGEVPIAAIIFSEDEIIAKNYATEKTDKRFLVHAELKALIEADLLKPSYSQRRKMQLFTTLEPCMMCLGAAMSFCIGEIHYALESHSDGAISIAKTKWSEENTDFPMYKLPKIFGGVLKEAGKQLFIDYIRDNENAPQFAKSLASLE